MNTREIKGTKQYVMIMLMVLIPFIYILSVMVYPLGQTLYYSLTQWNGVGNPVFVGLRNYKMLFRSPDFWTVTKNTLLLVLMCTAGQVGIALIISFLMTLKRLKFKEFHRSVIFFPVVMSSLVVGYVWRFIYNGNYGLLNTLLRAIGASSLIRPWLDDSGIVLGSVSVPVIWQYIGLYMLLMVSAISAIPEEVFESAELDGATGFKKSIYITLPMIWNHLKVCIILCVIGTMKIYDHLVALTNGGPGRASESLAMYGYDYTFKYGNFGMGSAIAILILVLSLLVSGIVQFLMSGRQKD